MANFNSIAYFYDFLKKLIFQSAIDRASSAFIDLIPQDSTILLIGGGSGTILTRFHTSHTILYLEQSSSMIALAKKQDYKANVQFVCADVQLYDLREHFDCVITPFILDCFQLPALTVVFQKLYTHLSPNGIWLHADFYPQNTIQKGLVKLMYFFFRWSTNLKVSQLPNFKELFVKSKFIQKKNHRFRHGLIQSTYYLKIGG